MAHQPTAMAAGIPPYAIALATRATSHGRVAIYAGAGISVAAPTSLPLGTALARTIYDALQSAFPALSGVAPDDLVAVADAVDSLPGGGDALRETAARAAEFREATPSYGHSVIAYLLLEGVVDVLTTNWDDCIERGGAPERIQAVTDELSLHRTTPPTVLKVHGCASEPPTLLITSTDLEHPPTWTREQTHARLGSAVVVFLGIGDVAGYVKQRIEEAIADVGDIANIRVVSPGIIDGWEGSQWSLVAPGLAEPNRIAATSDEFMECLGAAYINVTLNSHAAALADDPEVADYLRPAISVLLNSDALTVLRWVRAAAVAPHQGVSALNTSSMAEALTALGRLAESELSFEDGKTFITSAGPVEILVATKSLSAGRMRREAENRLAKYAANGEYGPRFLVAGGIGWPSNSDSLPKDVLSDPDSGDIVDGPLAVTPTVLLAREVLAS